MLFTLDLPVSCRPSLITRAGWFDRHNSVYLIQSHLMLVIFLGRITTRRFFLILKMYSWYTCLWQPSTMNYNKRGKREFCVLRNLFMAFLGSFKTTKVKFRTLWFFALFCEVGLYFFKVRVVCRDTYLGHGANYRVLWSGVHHVVN